MIYTKKLGPFNKKWTLPILVFFGLTWLASIGVCTAQTKITMKPEVTVPGPYVMLGNIAEIDGELEDFVETLKNIRICAAPQPNVPVSITKDAIKYRIQENRIDLDVISFAGPEKLLLNLETTTVSGEQFVDKAKEFIKEAFLNKDMTYEISVIRRPADRIVPKRDLRLETMTNRIGRVKGNLIINVGVYCGEKLFTRIPVQLNVRTFEVFVAAKQDLIRGQILTEDDLVISEDETTRLNTDILKTKKDLIGKEVKHNMKAGIPVKMKDVDLPRIVKRGEMVNILVLRGNIQVTSKGQAKKDGRKGDLIPVLQVNKKKTIFAEVSGPSTVIIK